MSGLDKYAESNKPADKRKSKKAMAKAGRMAGIGFTTTLPGNRRLRQAGERLLPRTTVTTSVSTGPSGSGRSSIPLSTGANTRKIPKKQTAVKEHTANADRVRFSPTATDKNRRIPKQHTGRGGVQFTEVWEVPVMGYKNPSAVPVKRGSEEARADVNVVKALRKAKKEERVKQRREELDAAKAKRDPLIGVHKFERRQKARAVQMPETKTRKTNAELEQIKLLVEQSRAKKTAVVRKEKHRPHGVGISKNKHVKSVDSDYLSYKKTAARQTLYANRMANKQAKADKKILLLQRKAEKIAAA